MDAGDEARTIGRRLRRIRKARDKSLEVIAGLAGMSAATLSRTENGLRALDSRSEIAALANALAISPSELTKLPVPAPCNGDTDAGVEAVRLALWAVSRKRPGGQVVSVKELRARARVIEGSDYQRRGELLPSLIRDLHTSITAGYDVAELLRLAVLVHAQTTRGYLYIVGANLDLRREAATLAQRAAEELDEPTMLGVAAWGAVIEMVAGSAFDLALEELDSVSVPTTTSESTQLAGFGPANVGLWRMNAALEVKDYEQAATIAENLNPAEHPSRERRATYWMDYGQALARIRGRQDDAVRAFRTAEDLFPMRVLRNPFVPDVLEELLARRTRRDAVGEELRGLADRVGVPT
jgi:transcriptional regulator with XRE-family HTH domain